MFAQNSNHQVFYDALSNHWKDYLSEAIFIYKTESEVTLEEFVILPMPVVEEDDEIIGEQHDEQDQKRILIF